MRWRVTVETGQDPQTWTEGGGPWDLPCPFGNVVASLMRALRSRRKKHGRPTRATITVQRLDCILCDGEGTRRPYMESFKPGKRAGSRCRVCKGFGEVEGPAVTVTFPVAHDARCRA